MTKLDKDQLEKITGGAGMTGQPQNQDLDGGTSDSSSDSLNQNEDLNDGDSGSGQPSFERNR